MKFNSFFEVLGKLILFCIFLLGVIDSSNINICHPCRNHLLKKKNPTCPKLSIANGNYIGDIGDIDILYNLLNRTDETCLAIVNGVVYVTTAKNSKNKVQQHHSFAVRNTEGPVITMFPETVNPLVKVTMVGPNTDVFQSTVRNFYSAHINIMKSFYNFLGSDNCIYANASLPSELNISENINNGMQNNTNFNFLFCI